MSRFGKGREYWYNLTDEQIMAITTLQNEEEKNKQKTYWDNWKKLAGGVR